MVQVDPSAIGGRSPCTPAGDGGFRHDFPSQSVWCNAIMFQKKDGSLPFCIDFCYLNTHTKKDSYPLLRIQEALENLVDTDYFSCHGLSKQYTTFTVGNLSFFKCDHMPFGLCNTPAMFQRLMQNCFRELNQTYCLMFLDDIIIFLQIAEEHLHCLHVVFD